MINLNVDEAYAFDYLSILYVKKDISEKNYFNWKLCYDFLKTQINNNDFWDKIINSLEFNQMIEANKITFDAVDKAKNNEVSAQYVDKCNYQRYLAKQNFQKKFFSDILMEVKIGYEKYECKN